MKETVIQAVLDGMRAVLTDNQLELLTDVTRRALSECEITPKLAEEEQRNKENAELLGAFISSKKVEGCSDKTIHYYKSSIEKLIATVKKNVCDISTNDIRCYLAEQQEQRGLSKVTIDNLRRIYSSFFSWLEDEDYITKSPVRRIHKVRTDALVKEVLTDENIEVLRDSCQELRDIAMIDLLLSTGMRVGELVKINREDIDFQERQCVVFGKGNKEREVYFNARTKIHLKKYLEQRTDTNPALFVSLHEPHTRLTISGVEVRLRQLGKRVNLHKVHPHKFRRTLATMAIDKADSEGGCSSDVLVFRAKNGHDSNFLYAVLMQDTFFDYAMQGAKGSKMPRGDKDQIMRYEIPTFSTDEEENIGKMVVDITSKIVINRRINDNLSLLDHSSVKVEVRLAA